jgi:ubiquitin-conjugating enzyme E2 J1
MFVWHFTIRGATETDFENGIYHGKILLPAEYPFKPPNILFTTPNGRFETNTKLCLSFSAYHPELWQPAWGIRLILEALISFLPTKGDGAIGALDWTAEERKKLAIRSKEYCCPSCGNCKALLEKWSERARRVNSSNKGNGGKKSMFQKEIEQLHAMQAASEGAKGGGKDDKENNDDDDDEVKPTATTTVSTAEVKNDKDSNEHSGGKDGKVAAEGSNDANIVEDNNRVVENTNNNVEAVEVDVNKNEHNASSEASSAATTITSDQIANGTTETVMVVEDGNADIDQDNVNNGDTTESELVDELGPEEVIIEESPLLSDPVVHTAIAIFSAIVILLIRKCQDIMSDLKELESNFISEGL